MKADVAKLWTDALRSGDYEQGRSHLRHRLYGRDQFCCMGVLCEIALAQGVDVRFRDGSVCSYDEHTAGAPVPVQRWAGLSAGGMGDRKNGPALYELNDAGRSFAEIADVIDSNVEAL